MMFSFGKVNKSIFSLDPMALECGGCECYTWGGTTEGDSYFDSTKGTKGSSNKTGQARPWGNNNGDLVK